MNEEGIKDNWTDDLTKVVTSWDYSNIPKNFNDQIKLAILDTLAVALAAQSLPDVQQMNFLYQGQSRGSGQLWWSQKKVSPLDAAFLNSYASHRLDFDCIMYGTYGHPTIMLLPVLSSMYSDLELNGEDLINATIIGLEFMSVIGSVFGESLRINRLHPTPILGGLASTAALGWMLNFSKKQMDSALSLTSSTVIGFKSSFGSIAKPYQVGMATRASLASAMTIFNNQEVNLQDTWLSNLKLISGNKFSNYPVKRFGDPWILNHFNFMFKYYPCCGYFHHAMNELQRVLHSSNVSFGNLYKVKLVLPRFIKDASIYERPKNFTESQFSIHFNAGLVIAFGEATLDYFTEEYVHDYHVLKAMNMIEIEYRENEDCINEENLFSGKAYLYTSSGEVFEDQLILSDYGTPTDFNRMIKKFTECANPYLTDVQISEFLELILNLEETISKDWRSFWNNMVINKKHFKKY
ncbi:MmgE/PrpD family protein [Ectobacillus antri]|uniref:MmgE/PrpD family protein n=1 Tax=Ectobacillus antri TaxID=2486280 RepID=UPI000F5A4A02|nr:MmgE/PrpD family protein [Ectobacillus antri]